MTKRWARQWIPALLACILLAACSNQPQGAGGDERDEISRQLGTVEKVSVLSTDGTEIPLDLQAFSAKLSEQSMQLEQANAPLAPEDVKYTLVVYRTDLAPLVIEVGAKASQLGDLTYGGEGAEAFYRWIRSLIGQALFQQDQVYTVMLSAADMDRTLTLSRNEATLVWEAFREAQYQEAVEQVVYPLYPYYQLNLDVGKHVLNAVVLTPSLVSLRFGREVLYYRVPGTLFSSLTEWIPPRPVQGAPIDSLFRATKLDFSYSEQGAKVDQTWNLAESIELQGRAHQLIRMMKQGMLLDQPVSLPEHPLYTVSFQTNDGKKTTLVYDKYFSHEGNVYAHDSIDDTIRYFLTVTSSQKTENKS
ncbi:MAG: hypothetical protein H0Z34_01825 [Brevibacillus sp.]|nr:hypothetical protein [Brevibacillus sp.]